MLAQSVAVLAIIGLSVFLSANNTKPIRNTLIFTSTGSLQFSAETTELNGIHLTPITYQLLTDSRFSFIGLWLIMQPNDTPLLSNSLKTSTTQLFIFRDSVSQQDFSRIANIIKKL